MKRKPRSALVPKPQGETTARSGMPNVPSAEVMSFLKDTRGALNWTTHQMAKSLRVSVRGAKQIVPVLAMQGYVKSGNGSDEWITTEAGEAVSGSKSP